MKNLGKVSDVINIVIHKDRYKRSLGLSWKVFIKKF